MSTDIRPPQPAAPCKFSVRRSPSGLVLEVQTSGITMSGSLTQAEALGLAMMLQYEVREQLFAAQQLPTEFVYKSAQRPATGDEQPA